MDFGGELKAENVWEGNCFCDIILYFIHKKVTTKRHRYELKKSKKNLLKQKNRVLGAFRESNSGPLAPKARIIPLDQMPSFVVALFLLIIIYTSMK